VTMVRAGKIVVGLTLARLVVGGHEDALGQKVSDQIDHLVGFQQTTLAGLLHGPIGEAEDNVDLGGFDDLAACEGALDHFPHDKLDGAHEAGVGIAPQLRVGLEFDLEAGHAFQELGPHGHFGLLAEHMSQIASERPGVGRSEQGYVAEERISDQLGFGIPGSVDETSVEPGPLRHFLEGESLVADLGEHSPGGHKDCHAVLGNWRSAGHRRLTLAKISNNVPLRDKSPHPLRSRPKPISVLRPVTPAPLEIPMNKSVKPRGFIVKLAALLAVLALLAAACGSDSSDSDETSADAEATEEATEEAAEEEEEEEEEEEAAEEEAAEEEPAEEEEAAEEEPAEDMELTASFRGVTEDTIKIGVSMLDFESLVSGGLSTEGWGDQQLVWETYIANLNANGGINGRMLEAVYSFYNPIVIAEAESSCIELTEDNETFAVLGGYLGPTEDTNPCITGVGETILVGGRQTDERLERSVAPWIQAPSTRERRLDIFTELLDQDGRIEGRKIAVVGSVELSDIAERAPEILEGYGADEVLFINNDVTQGDIQGLNDAWAIYAEAINAAGSEAVLLIGAGQGGVRGISNNGLDVETWVLEGDSLNNLGAETSPDQADGAITTTGLTDTEQFEDPDVQANCIEVFTAANPDVEVISPADVVDGEEHWFNSVINYCYWLELFEIVATEAGADLTQDSFAAAIESVGEIELSGFPFASLGPDKFDADDSFRLVVFDASLGEVGELSPLGEISNAAGS
jgi:hypothetical protein